MKNLILLLTIPFILSANSSTKIYQISPTIKNQMIRGGSWKRGCPVSIPDLRYLKIPYYDFGWKRKMGEMIVHKSVAKEVAKIFDELYKRRYPIKSMKLVSHYKASDHDSIEADNTSAFNCRAVTGGKKWSNHSYGKAIDINPIENPYISRSGHISHKKSLKYRDRREGRRGSAENEAVIRKGDYIIKLFKQRGWRWGGDWHGIKDYQHFDKPTKYRGNAR